MGSANLPYRALPELCQAVLHSHQLRLLLLIELDATISTLINEIGIIALPILLLLAFLHVLSHVAIACHLILLPFAILFIFKQAATNLILLLQVLLERMADLLLLST